MARDFLTDYLFITVGRVGSASELVTQKVVYAQDLAQKGRQLEKAIQEYLPKDGLAVVFVETKRGADSLEAELYEKGVKVAAIHGDRSQTEREDALAAFNAGRKRGRKECRMPRCKQNSRTARHSNRHLQTSNFLVAAGKTSKQISLNRLSSSSAPGPWRDPV